MVNSEDLRCSFCNKDQNDVRKLLAGPTVFICDKCIEVCNEIIAKDDLPNLRCAMCGMLVPPGDVVPIPHRRAVCVACTPAFETAIAEARMQRQGS